MSISVFLSAHAIQRIDERILQTDLKIMEILKKINESFSTGILVEPKHFVSRKEGGESARIYFPGFSFVFVVEKEDKNQYVAITLKNVFRPNLKGRKVKINYFLQNLKTDPK